MEWLGWLVLAFVVGICDKGHFIMLLLGRLNWAFIDRMYDKIKLSNGRARKIDLGLGCLHMDIKT